MKFSSREALLGLLVALCVGCVPTTFIQAPLQRPQVNADGLYAAHAATVAVTVKDERPADSFLGGGILGPNSDKGEGIFLAYQPETPDQLRDYMEGSAKAALATFNFTSGPAYGLEVRLKAARIDMYRYSGFSPMNCIGYLDIETAIKGPDGQEKVKDFKLTYYENTTPAMSMKEVVEEAVSRIYHQAVTESVVSTLQAEFPGAAEPRALAKTMATVQTSQDEIAARELVFLMGLTGREDQATKDGVVALFRTAKGQRVREGALEAVGMLGVANQASDIQGLLSGKQKIGDWDKDDTEEVWYMLKSLHLLGTPDLAHQIPVSDKLNGGARLKTLVDFMDNGQIPALSEKEKQGVEGLRKNAN